MKSNDKHTTASDLPAGKSSRKGVTRRVEGQITPASLPDEFLQALPPTISEVPEHSAYPKCVIRDGNNIRPECDPMRILYYVPEATYSPLVKNKVSTTYVYKQGEAITGNNQAYTSIERPGQPMRYTGMFPLFYVSSSNVTDWTISQGLGFHDLDIKLVMYRQAKEHHTMGLTISQSFFANPPRSSASSVRIKRLPITVFPVGAKLEPYTHYQPYKWVDQTTGNVLAHESMRTGRSMDGEAKTDYALHFSDSPPMGNKLRDIITAAWCISLWIDEWFQRTVRVERLKREVRDRERAPQLGFLARLLGGISKTPEDHSDHTSAQPAEGNPLREQLGLDAPNPNRGKDRLWYE